jgi:hypothetical protein
MFEVNQKLDIKGIDLFVDIQSIMPGAQGVTIRGDGSNYYSVLINGHKTYLSETILELFKAAELKRKEVEIKIAKGKK